MPSLKNGYCSEYVGTPLIFILKIIYIFIYLCIQEIYFENFAHAKHSHEEDSGEGSRQKEFFPTRTSIPVGDRAGQVSTLTASVEITANFAICY